MTVLTPCATRDLHLLHQAADSIRKQHDVNWRWRIAVDAAVANSVRDMLRGWSHREGLDPARWEVIETGKEATGSDRALTLAANGIATTWAALLEADDVLAPTALARQIVACEWADTGWAYGQTTTDTAELDALDAHPVTRKIEPGGLTISSSDNGASPNGAGMVMRSDLLRLVGIPATPCHTGTALLARLSAWSAGCELDVITCRKGQHAGQKQRQPGHADIEQRWRDVLTEQLASMKDSFPQLWLPKPDTRALPTSITVVTATYPGHYDMLHAAGASVRNQRARTGKLLTELGYRLCWHIAVDAADEAAEVEHIVADLWRDLHITVRATGKAGLGSDRSRALASTGLETEWAILLDSDDMLAPHAIDTLLDACYQHRTHWAHGRFALVNGAGERDDTLQLGALDLQLNPYLTKLDTDQYSGRRYMPGELVTAIGDGPLPFVGSGMLLRSELLTVIGSRAYRNLDDWGIAGVASALAPGYLVGDITYLYRQSAHQKTKDPAFARMRTIWLKAALAEARLVAAAAHRVPGCWAILPFGKNSEPWRYVPGQKGSEIRRHALAR